MSQCIMWNKNSGTNVLVLVFHVVDEGAEQRTGGVTSASPTSINRRDPDSRCLDLAGRFGASCPRCSGLLPQEIGQRRKSAVGAAKLR